MAITSSAIPTRTPRRRMRVKIGQLEEAFHGFFTDHHAFLLSSMLARIDQINVDIAALEARIEAEIAINTLLRRIPDLRLDDAVNPEWRPSFVLRGLKSLPASW